MTIDSSKGEWHSSFRLRPDQCEPLRAALLLRNEGDASRALEQLEAKIGLALDATTLSAAEQQESYSELRRVERAAEKLVAQLKALGSGARELLAAPVWRDEITRALKASHPDGKSGLVDEDTELYQAAESKSREVTAASLAELERQAEWLTETIKAVEPRRPTGRPLDLRKLMLAVAAFEIWTTYTDRAPTRSRGTTVSPWEQFVAAVFQVVYGDAKGSERYARQCMESSRDRRTK